MRNAIVKFAADRSTIMGRFAYELSHVFFMRTGSPRTLVVHF